MRLDSLRALLLEGEGYKTTVFEFISGERCTNTQSIQCAEVIGGRRIGLGALALGVVCTRSQSLPF